ncbi:hypothetical protein WK13_34900 [Burkholderia ubonensis]|uniref:phage tail protein n=1 Tax=Burkholderia ubonensis TaxID=101571 RepID=UPI00075E7374|nr:phage tail protein [Burkholderia ubonensis]KVR21730.1 hypothetical protein WK13_34900 [Burkholderia ubonensis]
MTIHMGVSRGPLDEIPIIKVADKTLWTGTLRDNGAVGIHKPDLFGGDSGEGGIDGSLTVMNGARSQDVNGTLQNLIGKVVPAFRGVFTLLFDGMVCAMNPYPKAWSFRMRRVMRGWMDDECWYKEKAVIWLDKNGKTTSGAGFENGGNPDLNKIMAMNPAHIIFECLTNREWGRGMPRALINELSFMACADKLADEGLGLCLRWTRQDSIQNFVQQVLDMCGGTLYGDRSTGQLTMTLIRDDYDPDKLPLFDYTTGLLEINEFNTATIPNGANEIIVTYHDPISNQDRQVRVQNLAMVQAAGRIITQSVTYAGVPTAELATRLAQRDLRANAPGLKRLTLKLDRRGWKIPPAGVFKIADPYRGVGEMILRVGKIEDGTVTDGAITITAVQDVFGMPKTSFVVPQPPDWQPPDPLAKPAEFMAFEVPYADLRRNLQPQVFNNIDDSSCYLGVAALRPTENSINYHLAVKAGGETTYTERGSGAFAPRADMDGALA